MVATVIPKVGCGHKLPVLLPADDGFDGQSRGLLLANLNNFAFDYVTRQKVQGTNVLWYIVEQLPVIAPGDYDRQFGAVTARS